MYLSFTCVFWHRRPHAVLPFPGSRVSNVTAIAARDFHNIALKSDGTVWPWGFNENGQLGNNNTFNQNTPVQVIFPPFSMFMPLVTR